MFSVFEDVYNNPEKYGFDRDKLSKPFIHSSDFTLEDGLSLSTEYMFWDDVHPTADVHALLADVFYQNYQSHYRLAIVEDEKEK